MAAKTLEIFADDVVQVLLEIEQSFAVKFDMDAFKDAKTFGDFSTIILSKINAENTDDCTSQQAFYLLKKAILEDNKISTEITPQTELSDIFPRETRKEIIKKIEERLGFKLDILTPKSLIVRLLTLLVVVSVIGLFIRPTLGFAGVVLSIVLFELAYKKGIEFQFNTVGDVANKMVKTNYFKSRRNPSSANFEEMETVIKTIFEEELGLNKGEIDADTVFSLHD
jgi:acyl carrier protein